MHVVLMGAPVLCAALLVWCLVAMYRTKMRGG